MSSILNTKAPLISGLFSSFYESLQTVLDAETQKIEELTRRKSLDSTALQTAKDDIYRESVSSVRTAIWGPLLAGTVDRIIADTKPFSCEAFRRPELAHLHPIDHLGMALFRNSEEETKAASARVMRDHKVDFNLLLRLEDNISTTQPPLRRHLFTRCNILNGATVDQPITLELDDRFRQETLPSVYTDDPDIARFIPVNRSTIVSRYSSAHTTRADRTEFECRDFDVTVVNKHGCMARSPTRGWASFLLPEQDPPLATYQPKIQMSSTS